MALALTNKRNIMNNENKIFSVEAGKVFELFEDGKIVIEVIRNNLNGDLINDLVCLDQNYNYVKDVKVGDAVNIISLEDKMICCPSEPRISEFLIHVSESIDRLRGEIITNYSDGLIDAYESILRWAIHFGLNNSPDLFAIIDDNED